MCNSNNEKEYRVVHSSGGQNEGVDVPIGQNLKLGERTSFNRHSSPIQTRASCCDKNRTEKGTPITIQRCPLGKTLVVLQVLDWVVGHPIEQAVRVGLPVFGLQEPFAGQAPIPPLA